MSRSRLRLPSLLSLSLALASLACAEPTDDDPNADDESDDGDSESGDGDGDAEPLMATWHQDIAPMMIAKCSGCHRDGGIAPFSLESYEQAAPWASLALDAIEGGEMPPWGQANTEECQPRHGFKDDPRLTDHELALLSAWIDADTPEGDPATAAPLPEPPMLELTDADVRLTTGELTLEPGKDQFWCFVLDPGFESSVFIDATQIVAGNEEIVHHVLIYVDESGQAEQKAGDDGKYECFGGPGLGQPTLVSAWAPGVPPAFLPSEVAMTIPAGAKLARHSLRQGCAAVPRPAVVDGQQLRAAAARSQRLERLPRIPNPGWRRRSHRRDHLSAAEWDPRYSPVVGRLAHALRRRRHAARPRSPHARGRHRAR
jgi:hypothetical protein